MRDRWAELISSGHSPRRWAVIVAAIATADTASVDRLGDPIQRGDETWCRVAITALESPTSAAEAKDQPDSLPDRCFTDPDLLRAWLNAPVAYAYRGRTIADDLDPVDFATASHEAAHRAVANLFEQAQDAGVFGINGYRLEVHRLVDVDDWPAGYLLVARPPSGPGLAADELDGDDLIPAESSFVEGSVRVLTNAAAVVDAMLDSRDAAPAAALPGPGPSRGQPFRAGADRVTPTPSAPPAAGAPTVAHHPRTL
jgi:hypothetical protein